MLLKLKLEAISISSTVHIRWPDNVGGRRCRFKQVSVTIDLFKTLDFVNFGGFRGFRFLDPPLFFWSDFDECLRLNTSMLGMMAYKCLHDRAPQYLINHLIPASDAAPRCIHRQSVNLHRLIVP